MPISNDTHGHNWDRFDLGAQDMSHTAYVRSALEDGREVWSIHSPDGEQIGVAPTRDLAFAAIIQHDLEPLSVH